MKNKLKMMITVALSMVIVTGCGAKSPTEVVNSYFEEIKKGENAQVTEYILENVESIEENTTNSEEVKEDSKMEEAMKIYLSKLDAKVLSEEIDGDKASVEVEIKENTTNSEEVKEDSKMEEAMKIYLSKLDAKVLSEEIDGDKASVEVEITGLNFSNIILEILGETLSNAFSGIETTEEDTSNSVLEKVKNGKVETRTGNVTLSKVDKVWKIESEDESFMGLVLGKGQSFDTNGAK